MKISEWRLKMSENVQATLTKISAGADKAARKFSKVQDNIKRAQGNLQEMAGEIPILGRALNLLKNPFALAAAGALGVGLMMGAGTTKALKYQEGMAQVNATAQLSADKLEILKNRLLEVKGVQPDRVPAAYEAILSQTNDMALSMDILETSVKGARAGFTDLDVVGKSLSKTLSIVGSENTNAQEVLDTFFKAKEVGAGEFKDFAEYVPGLIAAGKNLGIEYKEVTGLFSFMATQSKDAARATTLLENAFSSLGKQDILDGLAGEGVDVFNKDGSIKRMDEIFMALKTKLNGLTDSQKVGFFDSIGLRDIQAKEAISILTGDVDKLRSMLDATANATGSTEQALTDTINPLQSWNDATADLNVAMTKLGMANLPLVTMAAKVLGAAFAWMAENSEYVYAALIGLVIGIGVAAVSTGMLTTAVWANTVAWLANPMVWIPAVIMAVVVAIVYAWNKFEGFRGAILGVWEVLKGFGDVMKTYIINRIQGMLTGISGLGKAISAFFRGDWAQAWETGKEAVSDIVGLEARQQAAGGLVDLGKTAGEKFQTGYQKGAQQVRDKAGDEGSWMDQLGIGAPGAAGAGSAGGGSAAGGSAGGAKIQSGLSGISGGGKQIKSVTFNVNKLVEKIVIEAKETKQQGEALRKIVEEEIVRAFRGAELAISNTD